MKTLITFVLFTLMTSYAVAGIEPASRSTEQFSATAVTASPLQLQSNNAELAVSQSMRSHVWFYSVNLTLSEDHNNNGYYHRLDIRIDADTSDRYQQVYAEFSLLPSYGNERLFYTSSVFELFEQSNEDWLAIDTILERQYPRDEYLLIIRLFDAVNGDLLAEISGYDDASLDYLPLEDFQRDAPYEESGGSTGIAVLLGLCLLLWRRYSQTQHRAGSDCCC